MPVVRLFCLAVAVACAVTFGVTLSSERLERLFDNQSREVLAADLVFHSSTPLKTEQELILAQSPVQQARTLNFMTMARARGQLMLGAVKAVSIDYPLRGHLQLSERLFGLPRAVHHGPPRGEVWAEERVLHTLQLVPGDVLQVGEKSLRLSKVLVYEPDRGENLYSLTPRIMMNWLDVPDTRVVQEGSRMTYRYLFAGDADALDALRQALADTMQLQQRFVTVADAGHSISVQLDAVRRFLHLAALAAILLGAVAVAAVSFQYTVEMTGSYAILRGLGLSGWALRIAVLLPFLGFATFATGLGLVFGAGIHQILLHSLGGLLPESLPAAGATPAVLSACTVLIVVVSFAGPFLRGLWCVPPRSLLHRVTPVMPRPWVTLCVMWCGLAVLINFAVRDQVLTMAVLTVMSLALLLAWFVLQAAVRSLVFLAPRFGVTTQLAVRFLAASRVVVVIQVLAVASIVFALAMVQTVRDDLMRSWQGKIAEDAANFFVINLLPESLPEFQQVLEDRHIPHSPPYPIVRGRISAVNGVGIYDYTAPDTGREHESLDRDLALTWSTALPYRNTIVSGVWHGRHSAVPGTGLPEVSVEQGVASALDIHVGDTLEFAVNTQRVSAQVSSIRTVEWESFTPNFYMIFHPFALQGLPYTNLMSMRIDPQQRRFLPALAEDFSGATFFDVDFILQRIQGITQQLGGAVNRLLWLACLACFLVFVATEMILSRHRIYSSTLCKALGATSSQLARIFGIQCLCIGITAGLLAWIVNLLVQWFVVSVYIEGGLVVNMRTAIGCLIGTPVLVYLVGYRLSSRHRKVSPRVLLADT